MPDISTPADQPKYDPIQMLSDYLNDNKNATPNFRNFLINRLGDQIKWYDNKSSFFKKRWEKYRRIIIILSACIPFLVGLVDQDLWGKWPNLGLKLVIGIAGVLIAALEGLNALYKSQELYIAYRVTSERLRHEFSAFLGQVGDYSTPGEAAFSSLVAKVEAILAAENSQWADLARKNQRASMSEDIQKQVQDYLDKYGNKKADDSSNNNDQSDSNASTPVPPPPDVSNTSGADIAIATPPPTPPSTDASKVEDPNQPKG